MEKPMEYTYINIQSWMISELDLKGNELMIYAIIYGFCQDKESRFKGGRSYLARWTNSTVRGIQKNLNSLLEKGLIAKEEKIVNGTKMCDYFPINLPWEQSSFDDTEEINQASEGGEQSSLGVGNKVPRGGEQSSLGVGNKVPSGGEQSSPHNIKGNIKDNIESSSSSDDGGDLPLPFSPPEPVKGIDEVVERWNGLQKFGIPPVYRIGQSSERCKMLKARLREYGLQNVLRAIDNIAVSGFLQGKGRKGWFITFDWFVKPNNFSKVLEGNYVDADAGKEGDGYADTGRNPQQHTGRGYQESGETHGAKEYNPADYFGNLLDT